MEFCSIDEESEIVARICCCIAFGSLFYRQSVRNTKLIHLLLEFNRTVLSIPLDTFLTVFHLNTQELWKKIFHKYESLTWDSFFQLTSVFAIFPFQLIIKFISIIFNIDYTQPLSQQDVLVLLKEISSDSFYNSVSKSDKIEYPIHFNSLIQLLSQQKHSYDKLSRIRQYIRIGLLSNDKCQEICERPNLIQLREEYEAQYRKLPPNPCCYKIIHCGKNHPIRLHYDYEIPTYNRQSIIARFLENILIIFNPASIKSLQSHLTFYSIPKSSRNSNVPTSPTTSEREIPFKYSNRKKSNASSNIGNNISTSSSRMTNIYLQSQAQMLHQQSLLQSPPPPSVSQHQQLQQQSPLHRYQQQQQQQQQPTSNTTGSSLKKSINSQKNSVNAVLDINNLNGNCTVIGSGTKSSYLTTIKRNSIGALSTANNGLTSPFIKSQRVIHSCKNSVNSRKDTNTLINSPCDYKKSEFSPNDINSISLYNKQLQNIVSRKNRVSPLIPPRSPPIPQF